MKIDNEHLLPTLNKFKGEAVEKGGTTAVSGEKANGAGSRIGDRVELSANGSQIERLKKTMQVAPDFRADKVAKLKEQIEAGTYQVEGKAVAEKMLQTWRELHGR